MLQQDANKRFEFEDKPIKAVLTPLLIILLLLCYAMAKGATPHLDVWLLNHAYSLTKMTELLDKKDYANIMTMVYNTEFSSFHILQMGFSCYFFWVFGKHVEQKLGAARYMFLILLGLLIPFGVMQWDMQRSGNLTAICGPLLLLSTIIGTYLVFPPIPKSKIGGGEKRDKTQIFRRGGRPDMLEKYTANPFMFVVTFAVIQVLFHYWITLKKPFFFFEGMDGIDTVTVFPVIAGLAMGYGLGWVLMQQASAGLKESPMTLSAVKRYHELIDLDVCHEDALRGTARTLGLPYDKVKEWVAKNKGSMRIK